MLAGEIMYLKYWFPGLTEWVRLTTAPPLVPLDTEFQLECAYLNRSSGRVIGHVDLTITKPDSTQVDLEATANQDGEAEPDHGWLVVFSPIVLDQYGGYQGKFTLSLKEYVIGEETIEEQLASCWSYICGAGACGGVCVETTFPRTVWVLRGGVWQAYDTCTAIDQIGGRLLSGDVVWLYLLQASTLTYQDRTWNLVAGVNEFYW